jgi:hypothetical protein
VTPAKTSTKTSLPLFGGSLRQIAFLRVRRQEAPGHWVLIPQVFRPEELPTRAAVAARFGGGQYEVFGRDESNRRITARTRFVLEGEPLPLQSATADTSDDDRELDPKDSPARPSRALGSRTGEREAAVFRLLEQGYALSAITIATGIEARAVRGIFLEWITPLGAEPPTTPELVDHYHRARRAQLQAANEAEWECQWSR